MSLDYAPRITAIVDILGFSERIMRADDASVKSIIDALADAETEFRKRESKDPSGKIKFNIISDTVILSTANCSAEGYFSIFLSLAFVAEALFSLDFIFRGYVTEGKLYHHQQRSAIVGEALIRALEAEKKLCVYPRILVDTSSPAIDKQVNSPNWYSYDEDYMRPRDMLAYEKDGLWAYNLFGNIHHFTTFTKERGGLEKVASILNTGINIPNKSISSKYHWLADDFYVYLDENFPDKAEQIKGIVGL